MEAVAAPRLLRPPLLTFARPQRFQFAPALRGHGDKPFLVAWCGAIWCSISTLCWRKRRAALRAVWRSMPINSSTLRPDISAESSVSRSMC